MVFNVSKDNNDILRNLIELSPLSQDLIQLQKQPGSIVKSKICINNG